MTRSFAEYVSPGPLRRLRLVGALAALPAFGGCTAVTGGTALPGSSLDRSDSGAQVEDPYDETPGDGDGLKGDNQDASSGCDLTGTYAMQADLDVIWKGTSIVIVPVLDPGEGKLRLATKLTIKRAGTGYTAHVRACSAETPDFSSATMGEKYAVRFPDALWDAPTMPEWELPLEIECNEPGCLVKSATLYALLGVALADPSGPWPKDRRDPQLQYPDHDGDGKPGLTVVALNGGMYTYPPVVVFSARATELMLAIRVTSVFDGTVVSCDRLEGAGPGTAVETRAAGCIQDDGKVCGETDVPALGITSAATFLDENLPKWEVKNAAWTVVRIADDATCADVRSAAF